ncbi:hypothetical protein NQ317_008311, partial [Molorchus minor]
SPHQQKIVVPKVPKIHILRYVEVPRQEIIVPAYQRSSGKAARLRNEIPNDQNHKNVVVVPRQEVIVPNYVRFTQLPRSRQPDDARTTQVPRKANVAGSDQKQSRRPTGKPVHKYGNVKIPIQERVLPTNQIKPENKTQSEDKSGKTRAGPNHEDLVGGDKIVGGQDANIADYPYQLSLVIWKKYHFCGAALITPKFALTAAHCTYGRPSFDLSIRAGSSKYGTGGELIPIEQVTEHERYWEDNTDYDISLIELASPVTSKDAKPIELIHESPVPGDEAIISGWGRTARGTPSVLQVVKVPVVDQKVCSAAYSKVKNGKFDITDRMFCAGFFKEGGKDACQGDSGGPIVVKGKLAGVVSWGFGCALPKYPGVYTNVANLRDWIEDNISFGYRVRYGELERGNFLLSVSNFSRYGVTILIARIAKDNKDNEDKEQVNRFLNRMFTIDLHVRAGSSVRGSGGTLIPVDQIIQHEDYDTDSADYDISLLELALDATDKGAKPIALTETRPKPGDTAIVSGWGRLKSRGKSPSALQVVQVPIADQKVCAKIYGSSKKRKFHISDRMICAGDVELGGKGSCQGDSGGPLVVGGKLTGLVSWARGCALEGYPGVYASVFDFMDWIKENLELYNQ